MKFISQIIRFLYHFIVLFCFMTEIPMVGPLTTRRFALVVALGVIVLKWSKVRAVLSCVNKRRLFNSFILLLICVLITYFHHMDIVMNDNNTYIEYWYYVYIILYVFVFSLYCIVDFKSIREVALVWVAIMGVEAVAIYAAAISTPVRLVLYELFYAGDDRFEKSIEWGTRIVGIGIHSSTGSITMSATMVLITYLRIKDRISFYFYLLISFVLISSTMFIGRTGVLVELLIMAFYLLFYGVSIKKIAYIGLSGLLLFSFVIYLLQSSDSSNSDALLEWMTEALNAEKRKDIVAGVEQGGFPPFTPEFIFGTGLATGYNAEGVTYTSDSGFIRMWMSIGLVGFVAYYYAMFLLLTTAKIKKCCRGTKRFLYFVILVAFVIEYKEPFMMKYIFPWAIMTVGLFMSKENKVEQAALKNI